MEIIYYYLLQLISLILVIIILCYDFRPIGKITLFALTILILSIVTLSSFNIEDTECDILPLQKNDSSLLANLTLINQYINETSSNCNGTSCVIGAGNVTGEYHEALKAYLFGVNVGAVSLTSDLNSFVFEINGFPGTGMYFDGTHLKTSLMFSYSPFWNISLSGVEELQTVKAYNSLQVGSGGNFSVDVKGDFTAPGKWIGLAHTIDTQHDHTVGKGEVIPHKWFATTGITGSNKIVRAYNTAYLNNYSRGISVSVSPNCRADGSGNLNLIIIAYVNSTKVNEVDCNIKVAASNDISVPFAFSVSRNQTYSINTSVTQGSTSIKVWQETLI